MTEHDRLFSFFTHLLLIFLTFLHDQVQCIFKLPLLMPPCFVQRSISLHNLQFLNLLLDGIGVLLQNSHFPHLLTLLFIPLELLLSELLAISIGGVHDLPTLRGLHDGSSADVLMN